MLAVRGVTFDYLFIMQQLDLKTELIQKQHCSIYCYPVIDRCGLSLNIQKTIEPECYFQMTPLDTREL